jgi:hypothetical protein
MSDVQSPKTRNSALKAKVTNFKRSYVPAWLYKLDLYGFTPIPRYHKEKQYSFRGISASIIVLFVVIAYAAFTAVRYANEDPSISSNNVATSADPIEFPPNAILFRIPGAFGVLNNIFYDPRYFTFRFRQWTVYEQDRYNRTLVELGGEPCDVSSWAGWTGGNAWCPRTPPQLLGRYQSNAYNFYQIDVVACVNSTTSNITCASRAEISAIIESGRFNFLVNYQTFDGSRFESYNYFVGGSTYNLYELIHFRYSVVLNPNLLWRFVSQEATNIEFQAEKLYIKQLQTMHLTLFCRLGSFDVTETRNFETILDLVGSWYAFFGSIACVFALHLEGYNEEKFYRKCPEWDNFDENCKHQAADRSKEGTELEEVLQTSSDPLTEPLVTVPMHSALSDA